MKELELSLRLLLVGRTEDDTADLVSRILDFVSGLSQDFPIAFLDCKQVKR